MRDKSLESWVLSVAAHAEPSKVHWCDGSEAEIRGLERRMVADGVLLPLDPVKCPGSFLHRSHPGDVAGAEHVTFVSTPCREGVGPTNNWMSERDASRAVWPLFRGAMRGRTMFVVPYLLGPPGSRYGRVGVQITDSAYAVASLRLLTRMGDVALRHLGGSSSFVRAVHSLGDRSPGRRFVVHFPKARTLWSIGSGYGANAVLSKECHALRLASAEARDGGWLAEHMLVVGLTSPRGKKYYVAAAFPSGCGKASLAPLASSLPGWRVETVSDDVAWMHVGGDGRLWAVAPEAGIFGALSGANRKTNPNAIAALGRGVIFTDVALRADGTPWWEGHDEEPGHGVVDWRGRPWSPSSGERAAHPGARFTVSARHCPSASVAMVEGYGVPISAIIFGGRRAAAPLVYEATSWEHGVYVGATLTSDAAGEGPAGEVRNDPMAMLPFCGYHMADYFAHWLKIGARLAYKPQIFHVNWFREGEGGGPLWPGFGENVRALEWILNRVSGDAAARLTPIGFVPLRASPTGLDLPPSRLDELCEIDIKGWLDEARRNKEFLARFGSRLPEALHREHEGLERRLRTASN